MKKFLEDRCSLLAASIAYRALFSIIPITALLVAGSSQVLRLPDVRREVVDSVISRIPIGRGLVTDAVQAISESREPLTFFGILLLVWAAMGLFSTVCESLNVVWNVPARGFFAQRLFDLMGILSLGTLVLLSLSGTTVLYALQQLGVAGMGSADPRLYWALGPSTTVLTIAVTFVAFLFTYRFVPNYRHGIDDALPGAVLGTVAFEVAKHGFAWFVGTFGNQAVQGALGTVLVFLLWVYVSANILLAGAELNSVLVGVLPASMRECDPAEEDAPLRAARDRDPETDTREVSAAADTSGVSPPASSASTHPT